MNKKIYELMKIFNQNIKHYENEILNKDEYITCLKNEIKKYTKMYYETNDVKIKENIVKILSEYYDLLYYINAKKDKKRMYMLDIDIDNLPPVYLIDQKPEKFELDYKLLNSIDISEGLSEEQAIELLKWTVNNTRNNLNISIANRNSNKDVYNNYCLGGCCGFSQFSTLYPLQKLGFNVTINNIGSIADSRHAYGTVVIPINKEGKIVNKCYLIDCTYNQFFTVPFNVVSRFISTHPNAGLFVSLDEEEKTFARELLQKGFIEAKRENMEKYLKPFYLSTLDFEKMNDSNEEFSKIDINDVLNNQEEFDYTEEEFLEWGMNLSINSEKDYSK